MSPTTSRSQAMKMEYASASASQSKQHSEIAQDPYANQIANMGQSYTPIGYIPPQYIAQPSQDTNQPFMLAQHFTAIPDKQMLPLGIQSPVVPSLQPMPVPEMLHRDAIITSTQSHIQNQLQRKHEELQQLIMKQQEELQLVSEQLHLAQRGMLPVVSSTQIDPQYANRHQMRAHHMDKIGNNANVHRTVLRLMENSTIISNNEQQTYLEQSMNQSMCDPNEMPSNVIGCDLSGKAVEQLPQVHSSQDFQNSKALTSFDDTNPASMSPATPASISSSIKFTSPSE